MCELWVFTAILKDRRRLFFFKQKTAYDVVDCDWSSDVCSSDLAQGIDFRGSHKTSSKLGAYHNLIRESIPHYGADRFFAPDIERATKMILTGEFTEHIMKILPSGNM